MCADHRQVGPDPAKDDPSKNRCIAGEARCGTFRSHGSRSRRKIQSAGDGSLIRPKRLRPHLGRRDRCHELLEPRDPLSGPAQDHERADTCTVFLHDFIDRKREVTFRRRGWHRKRLMGQAALTINVGPVIPPGSPMEHGSRLPSRHGRTRGRSSPPPDLRPLRRQGALASPQ